MWKIPLPDGQSLLRPQDSRNLSPSLLKFRLILDIIISQKEKNGVLQGNGYLLEEEMIIDELFLILLAHALQRIELSFEVTLEGVASRDNLVHDLESLCL